MTHLRFLRKMFQPRDKLKTGAAHLVGRMKTGDHIKGEVIRIMNSRLALIRIDDVLVTADTRPEIQAGDRVTLLVRSMAPRIRFAIVSRRDKNGQGIEIRI